MRRIEEIPRKHGHCGYTSIDESCETRQHRIRVLYEDGDYSKPIVYSTDMHPIMEATMFLREEMKLDALNYQLQAASALKILYAYLEIFGIDIRKISRQQAKGFVEFARGTLGGGVNYQISLETLRCEKTVSCYLAVVRELVRYLELKNSPFLEKKQGGGGRRPRGRIHGGDFAINVRLVDELGAPKYVSVDQYKTLLKQVSRHEDLRDRVIIRLMREHGLRIGEVLGLTLEDIAPYVDPHGLPRYCLELRNRLSDAKDQRAKGAMKVTAESDYSLGTYETPLAGFQLVSIGDDLAGELLEYLELAHAQERGEGYLTRRDACARADKVLCRLQEGRENYYVFLNTLGRPLTAQRWGQILRERYAKAQIPLDYGNKRKNLSHRLRHGYCMFLKHELKLDPFQVMILMRHGSVTSQKAYDNPTPEDTLRLQEAIIDGR